MSNLQIKRATKHESKLRMALCGPPGSGKTWSALAIAKGFGLRIGLIDTEHGSAAKYSDDFSFDTVELASFDPLQYVAAIKLFESEGYDILIIDSLSHAWAGKDGALDQVDRAKASGSEGGKFGAWRSVTPKHNDLVEAMLSSRLHLIVTMRAKLSHTLETYTDKKGDQRTRVLKLGMQPIQREGIEYEFDIVGDLDVSNTMTISKTRCSSLAGAVIEKPDAQLAQVLKPWLGGVPDPERIAKQEAIEKIKAHLQAVGKDETGLEIFLRKNKAHNLMQVPLANLLDLEARMAGKLAQESNQLAPETAPEAAPQSEQVPAATSPAPEALQESVVDKWAAKAWTCSPIQRDLILPKLRAFEAKYGEPNLLDLISEHGGSDPTKFSVGKMTALLEQMESYIPTPEAD